MLEAMGYYEQPISSEFLVMVPMAFERNLLTNSDLDILLISMDIYGSFALHSWAVAATPGCCGKRGS